MFDKILILEKLEQVDEALGRIERRFTMIDSPDDFLDSNEGLDMLDGDTHRQAARWRSLNTILPSKRRLKA